MQIDTYESIYDQVKEFQGLSVFNTWFRVDARPFLQAVLNTIKKWSYMFKQHLIDHVTNSLVDLSAFIAMADAGLTKEVEEGDYDGLVKCMGHLVAVKERMTATDEMFEPLKQTIELLRQYGQELPENVHQLLQVSSCARDVITLVGCCRSAARVTSWSVATGGQCVT